MVVIFSKARRTFREYLLISSTSPGGKLEPVSIFLPDRPQALQDPVGSPRARAPPSGRSNYVLQSQDTPCQVILNPALQCHKAIFSSFL